MEHDFEKRYREGDTPWDHGMVDFNLIDAVTRIPIRPGRALDIGCGTGDNSLWLAQQGFEVTGCDLSQTAVERARLKAQEAGLEPCFIVADFLVESIPDGPYGFVFDRGCLHSVDGMPDRQRFAARVADRLADGGWWLSLIGNADEIGREQGPPQLTATEVAGVLEPFFKIQQLQCGHFGSDQENPPMAWISLCKKRL